MKNIFAYCRGPWVHTPDAIVAKHVLEKIAENHRVFVLAKDLKAGSFELKRNLFCLPASDDNVKFRLQVYTYKTYVWIHHMIVFPSPRTLAEDVFKISSLMPRSIFFFPLDATSARLSVLHPPLESAYAVVTTSKSVKEHLSKFLGNVVYAPCGAPRIPLPKAQRTEKNGFSVLVMDTIDKTSQIFNILKGVRMFIDNIEESEKKRIKVIFFTPFGGMLNEGSYDPTAITEHLGMREHAHIVVSDPEVMPYVISDVAALVDISDVVIIGRSSGYGILPLIVMTRGKPVVAPEDHIFKEYVGERGYLIKADEFSIYPGDVLLREYPVIDPEKVCDILHKVFSHPEELKRKSEESMRYAESMTWDSLVHKLEKLLEM